MKISLAATLFLSLLSTAESKRNLKIKKRKKKSKNLSGLCVVGCTPYVNPDDETSGILKWKKLVDEMAESCEIMIHVGDTKAGAAPCNKNIMVRMFLVI